MNPILFALNNLLTDGEYLPGSYSFAQPALLNGAVLTCTPPTDGDAVLTLIVGGVATAVTLRIPAGTTEFTTKANFSLMVAANTAIQWLCSETSFSAPENAPTKISITMEVDTAGAAAQLPMTVRWVDGPSQVTLYSYDPVSGSFNDVSGGLSAVYASIATGANFTITFNNGTPTVALNLSAGTLHVNSLITGILTPPAGTPRLQFLIGNFVAATVTGDGTLYAPNADDGAIVAQANQFLLNYGGTPGAAVMLTGVMALDYEQPI